MIPLVFGIVGAIVGARIAAKRGGNGADMAQYAFGYGVALFLAAYVVVFALNLFL